MHMRSYIHVFMVPIVFYNMFVLFSFAIIVSASVRCPDTNTTHPNIILRSLHCAFYLNLYVFINVHIIVMVAVADAAANSVTVLVFAATACCFRSTASKCFTCFFMNVLTF